MAEVSVLLAHLAELQRKALSVGLRIPLHVSFLLAVTVGGSEPLSSS